MFGFSLIFIQNRVTKLERDETAQPTVVQQYHILYTDAYSTAQCNKTRALFRNSACSDKFSRLIGTHI